MAFRIEAEARLVFTDSGVCMIVGGQTLDLFKVESVEEFHSMLYALGSLFMQQVGQQKKGANETTANPIDSVAEKMSAEFRRAAQNATDQYDELKKTYESAVDNLAK